MTQIGFGTLTKPVRGSMSNKPRILIFFKDLALKELLSDILANEGCHVFVADDFYDAIEILALHKVVGAVVGVNTPAEEELRLLRLIDENVLNVSTISVHNSQSAALTLEAAKAGSHDCRSLPLTTSELRLVMRGLKKRIADNQRSLIELGNMIVDRSDDAFYINRIRLCFSPAESRLLLALAKKKNQILTLAEMKQAAFFDCHTSANSRIYYLLKTIRVKLQKAGLRRARIETVKGQGYTLTVQSKADISKPASIPSAHSL